MKMKKLKAISPLVAVIMLIAFTMIVAGILAGWATRFATEQRTQLELCAKASFLIKRATYENATNTTNLLVFNAGTVPLKGFNILVTPGTGDPKPVTNTTEIPANAFETLPVNLTKIGIDPTNIDYIEVTSQQCPGAYDMIRSYDIKDLPE